MGTIKNNGLFELAINIALAAHKGKIDKGGVPYIFHPLRLMMALNTLDEKIVALLHDVVEDSPITIQNLSKKGFSKKVLTAVSLLTKTNDQSYDDYIINLKKNALAYNVKLADLNDNMNVSRLKKITEVDKKRLENYQKALTLLNKTK